MLQSFQVVVVDDVTRPARWAIVELATNSRWVGHDAFPCCQLWVALCEIRRDPPCFNTTVRQNVGQLDQFALFKQWLSRLVSSSPRLLSECQARLFQPTMSALELSRMELSGRSQP